MTDVKLLREIIESKGVKYVYIAEELGFTRQGFHKKLEDGTDFKAWQMIKLQEILNLTDEQSRSIFYPCL